MGKRNISQARGHGSHTYRAHSFHWLADMNYPSFAFTEGTKISGKIIDICHDPGRNAPLGKIVFDDEKKTIDYLFIPEGMKTGDIIEYGATAAIKPGNIVQLSRVPEGTAIFNIEINPFDGGKMVKASGSCAIVVSQSVGRTIIKLPSKKVKELSPRCRVTIGVLAGGERKNKPIVKAGNKYYATKARGKLYPRTSARAMNAVDHKFGGSHLGVPKTSSRHSPPGRKVGSIAASRTGRKKR
ncbi:MAG: 50S ribosomal protein L2 [Nanoarchaeota archaeon]|nr:50S ribosomal protein L2 [Nanoarchaeota archaeon]MBU4452344.1 50S ribosomal protein L2 [Nanoarchaeota archaeon]MCG2723379.1 50S ribosomal protein L2 [archaeon]